MRRAIARAAGLLALAGACAALLAAWLAPGNVLALWRLAAWCQ
jgi:hypothetical protein